MFIVNVNHVTHSAGEAVTVRNLKNARTRQPSGKKSQTGTLNPTQLQAGQLRTLQVCTGYHVLLVTLCLNILVLDYQIQFFYFQLLSVTK